MRILPRQLMAAALLAALLATTTAARQKQYGGACVFDIDRTLTSPPANQYSGACGKISSSSDADVQPPPLGGYRPQSLGTLQADQPAKFGRESVEECLRLGYAVAIATDEYCVADLGHQEDTNGVDIHLPYLRTLGFPSEVVGTPSTKKEGLVTPNSEAQKDTMDPATWKDWINVQSVPTAGAWGTAKSPIQCHRIDPKGDASLGDVVDKGGMLQNIAAYYQLPVASLVLFDDTSANLGAVEAVGASGVSTSNCAGRANGYCNEQCGLTNQSLQEGLKILARIATAERREAALEKEEGAQVLLKELGLNGTNATVAQGEAMMEQEEVGIAHELKQVEGEITDLKAAQRKERRKIERKRPHPLFTLTGYVLFVAVALAFVVHSMQLTHQGGDDDDDFIGGSSSNRPKTMYERLGAMFDRRREGALNGYRSLLLDDEFGVSDTSLQGLPAAHSGIAPSSATAPRSPGARPSPMWREAEQQGDGGAYAGEIGEESSEVWV